MISFNEKRRLMAMLPEFILLANAEHAAAVLDNGAVEAASVADVEAAIAKGFSRREIFFSPHTAEAAGAVLDKCRLIADSWEDLLIINEAAAAANQIVMVGLRLLADGYTSNVESCWTTGQLRKLVHDIKQLKAVSVCGCIIVGNVEGHHGKELGKYVRSSYQTAKNMTYILPCTMPYISIAGILDAMAWNEAAHPETLEAFVTAANIVGMQNSTAFYADYYMQ